MGGIGTISTRADCGLSFRLESKWSLVVRVIAAHNTSAACLARTDQGMVRYVRVKVHPQLQASDFKCSQSMKTVARAWDRTPQSYRLSVPTSVVDVLSPLYDLNISDRYADNDHDQS